MDEFDALVRRRCCKLTPELQLKTGFKTKSQLKNGLLSYKDPSIQKDFSVIGKNLTKLFHSLVIADELGYGGGGAATALPANYSHRPQPITSSVHLSRGQTDEIITGIENLNQLEDNLTQLTGLLEAEKGEGGPSAGPGSPDSQFLERQIEELKQQIKDQRARNRVEQNVLAQREMDVLEELETAEDRAREMERSELKSKENAIRGVPRGELKEWIDQNWEGNLQIRMEGVPIELRKNKTSLKNMAGKTEYLLNVLEYPVEDLYGDLLGYDEAVGSEPSFELALVEGEPVFRETSVADEGFEFPVPPSSPRNDTPVSPRVVQP